MTEFASPDYELRWPPDLFLAEFLAVADADEAWVANLLAEAFVGTAAAERWNKACSTGRGTLQQKFIDDIQRAVELGELRQAVRRPLWSERHGAPRTPGVLDAQGLRVTFARAAGDLAEAGYFDRDCYSCPDDDGPTLGDVLFEELGIRVWPFAKRVPTLDDPHFYDLVELLHEHAARPRSSWYHDFHRHYHYGNFSRVAGQAVYRWKINELFNRSDVGLRLADSGEDQGHLVTAQPEALEELMEEVRGIDPARVDAVSHAIALFRNRRADVHAKRSAIITLHRLIDERRSLLNTQLLTKDEDVLFQIANQFDLRHSTDPGSRKQPQYTDYDSIFLDWIFWWYLATVQLIDRLERRPS